MIPGCGIDFERATEKPQSMSLTQSARAGIRDALGVVKLIAGLVLLVALSWEIIAGDHVHMSRTYLAIQFVVCLVFLCDFFVRWAAAERPGRFFWRNLPFLLLSVPYLNILAWSGVGMTHDWGVLVGLIPLLRAFLAMVIIVRWLVSENRMRRLFFAYIFTVVIFTYISGLVVLRLRGARQSQAPRLRQCALVGVDERHDRRCGDFPRHGRRQGLLRAASVVGHDVLSDLHDLCPAGVHP